MYSANTMTACNWFLLSYFIAPFALFAFFALTTTGFCCAFLSAVSFFYIFHCFYCFYCFYCFSAFVIAMLSVSRVARKQQAWICITDFQWQQRCIGASAIFNAAINGFAGAEKHALSFVDLQCRTNSENGVTMQILKFSCKKFTAACSGKSKMYTLSFQLLLLCVFFFGSLA